MTAVYRIKQCASKLKICPIHETAGIWKTAHVHKVNRNVPQAVQTERVHAILLAVQRLKYQTLENSHFRADDGILWAFTLMKYPI